MKNETSNNHSAQRPGKMLDTEGWEPLTSSVPSEGDVVTVCHNKGGWVLHDVLYSEGKFTERVRTQVGGDAAYVSKERVPGPVVFPTHWLQWKNRHLAPAQPPTVQQFVDAAVQAFGLGPENEDEVLAFGMKVEDILNP